MTPELIQPDAARPLAQRLHPGVGWSLAESLAVLRPLVLRVQSLHEAGRIHRAIGVEAVSLDGDVPRLAQAPTVRRLGGECADPEYCPLDLAEAPAMDLPEPAAAAAALLSAHGCDLDPRQIDLYQLGALWCRFLTGSSVRSYMYTVTGRGKVPSKARAILERALGHDATGRYASAAELAAALATLEAPPEKPRPADPHHGTASFATVSGGEGEMPSLGSPPAAEHRPASAGRSPTSSDLPFAQLGHYRILDRLGRGGMGDVYRAYDLSLDREVAIKVLPAELARETDFVRRFHAEATAAANLSHPNVVPVYYIGEDAGHYFFAMQYIVGESLAQRLAREPKLPRDEAVAIVQQCLAGLEAAHQQGMIHRDVKPANILLERPTGRAMLVDFGLVRRLGQAERLTAAGIVMGTVDYIAPEQARGLPVDGRADLYALGVLLYQLLAGRLPFTADTPTTMVFQHAYESPFPLDKAAPEVPGELIDVVARLMEKDPKARYQTAGEVLADLRAYREGHPLQPATTKAGIAAAAAQRSAFSPRRPARRRWRGWVIALTAAALCGAGLGGWLAVTTPARKATPEPAEKRAAGAEIASLATREAQTIQADWAARLKTPVVYENSIGMKFVLIPPGEFEMGTEVSDVKRLVDEARREGEWYDVRIPSEAPRHPVTITKPFYLGVYEVRQADFQRVLSSFAGQVSRGTGPQPAGGKDAPATRAALPRSIPGQESLDLPSPEAPSMPDGPIHGVNWDDANKFCERLGQLPREYSAGVRYRLPTEAEWEYACRAGTTALYCFGNSARRIVDYAWCKDNAEDHLHPVGRLKPNAWGLYDMYGNAWEWCADWFGDYRYQWTYANPHLADPEGPSSGQWRVLRGGSFTRKPSVIRSAFRNAQPEASSGDDFGFRVVMTVPSPHAPPAMPGKTPGPPPPALK